MSGISFNGNMGDPKNAEGVIAGMFNSMGGSFKDAKGNAISYDDLKAQHPEWGDAPDSGSAMKKGGKVSSASRRADGIATRGKTRGKIV